MEPRDLAVPSTPVIGKACWDDAGARLPDRRQRGMDTPPAAGRHAPGAATDQGRSAEEVRAEIRQPGDSARAAARSSSSTITGSSPSRRAAISCTWARAISTPRTCRRCAATISGSASAPTMTPSSTRALGSRAGLRRARSHYPTLLKVMAFAPRGSSASASGSAGSAPSRSWPSAASHSSDCQACWRPGRTPRRW